MHVLIIPSELFVTHQDPLAGIFQLEQAKALRNRGHDVGVISVGSITLRHLFRRYDYNCSELIDGVNVYRCYRRAWSMQRFVDPYKALAYYTVQISALYAKYEHMHGKPQIIHAHNLLFAGLLAKHISDVNRIPFVVTEHSSLYARFSLVEPIRPLVHHAAQASHSLTCVSHSLGQDLKAFLGLEFEVLPNLVDSLFFENQIKSFTRNYYTFINVASLDSNKNQKIILEAFAFNFKGMNVRLKLVGDGPLRGQLERLASRLDISSQVSFMGQLSRFAVSDEMMTADCFVLSSSYETFGVVLIEALASGLPLIATRCGGPQDIVSMKNGILVETSNVSQLGRAMRFMHANRHKFNRFQLRKQAQQRFGPSVFVDRTEKIYGKVLDNM